MIDKINTGGPAFPVPGLSNLPNGDFIHPELGMTLRDYFAGKALPEFLTGYFAHADQYGYAEDWKMCVAMDAYSMAEAMIKARDVVAQAKPDEVVKQRDDLLAALQAVVPVIERAFEFDGDVFGLMHNDALDAEMQARAAIDAVKEATHG